MKHGHAQKQRQSSTYRSWRAARYRATSARYFEACHYQARGIGMCERWATFENFLADMGERPPGMTLERVDNNRGYAPDNCVWATPKAQARNRRRRKDAIMFDGKTLMDWAAELGVTYNALAIRLRKRGTIWLS